MGPEKREQAESSVGAQESFTPTRRPPAPEGTGGQVSGLGFSAGTSSWWSTSFSPQRSHTG